MFEIFTGGGKGKGQSRKPPLVPVTGENQVTAERLRDLADLAEQGKLHGVGACALIQDGTGRTLFYMMEGSELANLGNLRLFLRQVEDALLAKMEAAKL